MGKDATKILSAASHLGLVNLVHAFCEAGYPVQGVDFSSRTTLHKAVIRRSLDIVKLLVRNGADVNLRDEEGKTPLHYAIENGEIGTIAFLLASRCEINSWDKEMRTPLQDAASLGQAEIVKALIESGANVNAKPQASAYTRKDGKAPWNDYPELVTDDAAAKMVSRAREKEYLTAASSTRFSAALFSAISNCHLEVANILREVGAYLPDEASRVALEISKANSRRLVGNRGRGLGDGQLRIRSSRRTWQYLASLEVERALSEYNNVSEVDG